MQTFADQVATAVRNARLYEEIQKLATVDELMGIYNRRGFIDVCLRELARLQRTNHRFSVLFVDIDHFKQFNDLYSYEVGDYVLRAVADTLRKNIREIDVIGRFGGEEIVILLPEIDQAEAVEIAERLRSLVEDLYFRLGDHERVSITVSIGVAVLVTPDERTVETGARQYDKLLEEVILNAGQALHIAKQRGRNQVAVYSESTNPNSGDL